MLNIWGAVCAATALTVTATATLPNTITSTNAARPQHAQFAVRRQKHILQHFLQPFATFNTQMHNMEVHQPLNAAQPGRSQLERHHDERRGQDAAQFWQQTEQQATQHSHMHNITATLQTAQGASMDDKSQLEKEDKLVPKRIHEPDELEHRRQLAAVHNSAQHSTTVEQQHMCTSVPAHSAAMAAQERDDAQLEKKAAHVPRKLHVPAGTERRERLADIGHNAPHNTGRCCARDSNISAERAGLGGHGGGNGQGAYAFEQSSCGDGETRGRVKGGRRGGRWDEAGSDEQGAHHADGTEWARTAVGRGFPRARRPASPFLTSYPACMNPHPHAGGAPKGARGHSTGLGAVENALDMEFQRRRAWRRLRHRGPRERGIHEWRQTQRRLSADTQRAAHALIHAARDRADVLRAVRERRVEDAAMVGERAAQRATRVARSVVPTEAGRARVSCAYRSGGWLVTLHACMDTHRVLAQKLKHTSNRSRKPQRRPTHATAPSMRNPCMAPSPYAHPNGTEDCDAVPLPPTPPPTASQRPQTAAAPQAPITSALNYNYTHTDISTHAPPTEGRHPEVESAPGQGRPIPSLASMAREVVALHAARPELETLGSEWRMYDTSMPMWSRMVCNPRLTARMLNSISPGNRVSSRLTVRLSVADRAEVGLAQLNPDDCVLVELPRGASSNPGLWEVPAVAMVPVGPILWGGAGATDPLGRRLWSLDGQMGLVICSDGESKGVPSKTLADASHSQALKFALWPCMFNGDPGGEVWLQNGSPRAFLPMTQVPWTWAQFDAIWQWATLPDGGGGRPGPVRGWFPCGMGTLGMGSPGGPISMFTAKAGTRAEMVSGEFGLKIWQAIRLGHARRAIWALSGAELDEVDQYGEVMNENNVVHAADYFGIPGLQEYAARGGAAFLRELLEDYPQARSEIDAIARTEARMWARSPGDATNAADEVCSRFIRCAEYHGNKGRKGRAWQRYQEIAETLYENYGLAARIRAMAETFTEVCHRWWLAETFYREKLNVLAAATVNDFERGFRPLLPTRAPLMSPLYLHRRGQVLKGLFYAPFEAQFTSPAAPVHSSRQFEPNGLNSPIHGHATTRTGDYHRSRSGRRGGHRWRGRRSRSGASCRRWSSSQMVITPCAPLRL